MMDDFDRKLADGEASKTVFAQETAGMEAMALEECVEYLDSYEVVFGEEGEVQQHLMKESALAAICSELIPDAVSAVAEIPHDAAFKGELKARAMRQSRKSSITCGGTDSSTCPS